MRCANLMLQELAAWNASRTAAGAPPLGIGIGVNYGPAVMGDVGSEHTLAFTVIGDTVNVASRLQSLTRELGVPLIVADPVLRQIGGGALPAPGLLPVALNDQGPRDLRGRSEAVHIWVLDSTNHRG